MRAASVRCRGRTCARASSCTRARRDCGVQVFGAAVLGPAPALETVVADTNHETESPLFHAEVYVIQRWAAETPAESRGESASQAVFLSTHEPCCMCISSLVWAGFRKVYYLFPYLTTSQQGIPHDLDIMHELWNVPSYQKQNKFMSTACIIDQIQALPDGVDKDRLEASVIRITAIYDGLSSKYHSEKVGNPNNSLAFA